MSSNQIDLWGNIQKIYGRNDYCEKTLTFLIGVIMCLSLIFAPDVQAYAFTEVNNTISDSVKSDEKQVEGTIKGYYEASYDMWWNLKIGDLTGYLDMDSIQCQNKVTILTETIQKWKYMMDKSYYKGQRERHDIYFNFETVQINGREAQAVVNISGETDGMPAYPFFVCFGKNTFNLRKVNNNWLIYNHDYEDNQLYEGSKTEKINNDIETYKLQIDKLYDASTNIDSLKESIQNKEDMGTDGNTYTTRPYSTSRAIEYANRYVYNRNTYFYDATEDGGDCTNFVSQCVSYAYGWTLTYYESTSFLMMNGSSYTDGWYGGGGGGNAAWENAGAFWNYMITSKNEGPQFYRASTYQNGYIMQVDWKDNSYCDGSFDHSTICVDATNSKFAEHTPNGYRYLADYNGNIRYLRPSYFKILE